MRWISPIHMEQAHEGALMRGIVLAHLFGGGIDVIDANTCHHPGGHARSRSRKFARKGYAAPD